MSKLIRWDTPFTDKEYPSVFLFTCSENRIDDDRDKVAVIVSPNGVDKYPKHLINFGEIFEFQSFEKGYSPKRSYSNAYVVEKNLSAYKWEDSPSVKEYEKGLPFIGAQENDKLNHFIIFGGDSIIEVVTKNEPLFETIDEPKTLNLAINL